MYIGKAAAVRHGPRVPGRGRPARGRLSPVRRALVPVCCCLFVLALVLLFVFALVRVCRCSCPYLLLPTPPLAAFAGCLLLILLPAAIPPSLCRCAPALNHSTRIATTLLPSRGPAAGPLLCPCSYLLRFLLRSPAAPRLLTTASASPRLCHGPAAVSRPGRRPARQVEAYGPY